MVSKKCFGLFLLSVTLLNIYLSTYTSLEVVGHVQKTQEDATISLRAVNSTMLNPIKLPFMSPTSLPSALPGVQHPSPRRLQFQSMSPTSNFTSTVGLPPSLANPVTTMEPSQSPRTNIATVRPAATMIQTHSHVVGHVPKVQRRPLFVYHKGPGKTGTSTIQCQAGAHVEDLQQDGIHYMGTSTRCTNRTLFDRHQRLRDMVLCTIQGKPENECQRRVQELTNDVRKMRDQNLTLFISEECDTPHMSAFLADIRPYWDFQVILTYRRYYEWLVSMYGQIYALENGQRNRWPRNNVEDDSIPSFRAFFVSERAKYNMIDLLRADRRQFGDVRIFNMHGDKELATRFFCQMVPGANRTCESLSQNKDQARANVRDSRIPFVFDRIAAVAYQRGWVKRNLSRPRVRKAVQKHLVDLLGNQWEDTLPVECLTDVEIDELLNISIATEKEWLPESFVPNVERPNLLDSFDDAKKRKTFCSANVELILDNSDYHWISFFDNLA
eukprot:scaffold353_cov185-Amphora_coffeaeformis.AAC.87